jgi:hypothetical protein
MPSPDGGVVVRPVPISRPAAVTPPASRRDRSPRRARGGTARAPAPVPTAAPGEQAEEGGDADLIDDMVDGYVARLRASGETEGLAAFPPKGTNPPKPGLVVPEDFELPEGYVRYYQITDGGQRLEPILMFSPDYEFVDRNGHPVALPEDGIVPPEMAPPGLPGRMLDVPDAESPTG